MNYETTTPSDKRAFYLTKQINALFHVSQVLSRSLNFEETLQGVLQVLHEDADMTYGMVTLEDPQTRELLVKALHGSMSDELRSNLRYQSGEGIIGKVMTSDNVVVVERIADEPSFVGKTGLYDSELPFIGVPIHHDRKSIGVLVAQPKRLDEELINDQSRLMEMVANLIAQSVRLSMDVAKEKRVLADERDSLRRVVRNNYGFANMVGHTAQMKRVFELVRQVAKWNTTVLIRGESGTGKELIANAIHYNSPRANASFVKLNCAALPDTLLESELFGHEKGAFTGAVTQRKGRFEQADGGTIFLDEIGEISASFQAKLLRVLQEGELERVGGTKTIKVDVRVVAATNVDLESAVEAGDFREDLYYRLNVMPINLPALRDRIEDIPDLAKHLVTKISKQQGRDLGITESAFRILSRHNWPGNVRELENRLERAAIMSEDGTIDREALAETGLEDELPVTAKVTLNHSVDLDDPDLDERERVIAALEQAGWVQAKAARLLNMTPRQIAYRIQTLNIKVRQI